MVEHERTGWLDKITHSIAYVGMFIVPFIVSIMVFEVVSRYIFLAPTLWVNEASMWAAGAVYLLGGLYVMQQRGHIRIFILYDVVPRSVQRFFDVISTSFIVLFAIALVWGGYREAMQKLMRWETFGTAWDPPIPATMKPALLIIVVLIAVQAVSNLINDWNKEPEIHDEVEEIAAMLKKDLSDE